MNQFKIPILSEGFSEPRSGIEKPRSFIDVTERSSVKSTNDDAEPPITNEPLGVDPGVVKVSLEVNCCPKDDCQKKECECKDCYGDDCKCGEDKCCIPCKCEKKEEVEPTCCQRWFPQITLFFKK